jgi:cysteine desulfurase/selenocysteine lyase
MTPNWASRAQLMDPAQFKRHFPALAGDKILYFDNATANPLPGTVVHQVTHFLEHNHYFPNKGMHDLTIESTQIFNRAKRQLGEIIGIPKMAYEFPPNVTIALANLILGTPFQKGEALLVTANANHALLGPILQLAERLHYTPIVCPLNHEGQADPSKFEEILKTKPVKLAIWPILPVGTGIIQESRPLIDLTRQNGVTSVIDLTRALGHVSMQFQKVSPDIVLGNCWTGVYAPQGAAFAGISEKVRPTLNPPIVGEGNITEASWTHITPNAKSAMVEGGDINMGSIAGLDAGLAFLGDNSPKDCIAHELTLLNMLLEQLREIPKCHILGHLGAHRSLLMSFSIKGMDAHDIGMYMNELHHTIVRTGQLCSQPFLTDLRAQNVVQVSVAPFITKEDIQKFAQNLREIVAELG